MIDKSILEKYADIKNTIKVLENEAAELVPQITQAMQDEGQDKLETDFGKFTLGSRRVWTYPQSVKDLEDSFKKGKKEAEQLGTATYDEVPQLKYFFPGGEDSVE